MKVTFLGLCLLALLFTFTTQTFAVDFTVTRTDDRNTTCNSGVDCSLREAVGAANAAATDDTINFASGLTTITLTNEIVIANSGTLAVQGLGTNVLTISGNNRTRIFLTELATIAIRDVTLTEGSCVYTMAGFCGAAVYANEGSLTLDRVYVLNNNAGSFGSGGGIYLNGGTHFILNSTFYNNYSGTRRTGGGIVNSGGTLTIVNSTISNNRAGYGGGGILNNGNLTLRNVTIFGNSANPSCFSVICPGTGGGLYHGSGNLNISNTIIAGNVSGGEGSLLGLPGPPEIDFAGGTITSEGNNLIGDSTGDATYTRNPINYQPSDILDTNPQLDILQNNGGTTPTHALLAGSPAIDRGLNANVVLSTDQRGFPRIVDGNNDGIPTVDIGAFEVQPVVVLPTKKEQCKNGGWMTFTIPRKFKNQGDCIQFVNTGK
jgi:hypothetical protein